MTKRLVIVESPTKAKTLRRFLGGDYIVESSVGHIRDLPASAAEIPEKYRKEPWARLGVNIESDFEPLYIVQPEKKKVIRELKSKLKGVDELLLATDEDREGEAISWHLIEELKPRVPVRRMVFHEITREAILAALDKTRDLDRNLVEAYRARRIVDRLYGYEVSPVLWRKVAPRLSAGRVQSVAIRIIVERELERMSFRSSDYWDLSGDFRSAPGEAFPARLVQLDGAKLAGGKSFDPDTGRLKDASAVQLDEAAARALAGALADATFRVASTEEKPFTQSPAPPFTTSTLQQEGGRKLGFDASRTMRAAQRLYELGFITYMRTDSVALSPEALRAARGEVKKLYGPEFLPDSPRVYKTKVKNAQEAHEAIRPAGATFQKPEAVAASVSTDEARLYQLIWKRTVACQMRQAHGRRMVVRLGADAEGREAVFQANGRVIDFPGFLRAYVEGTDDPQAELADRDAVLPPVAEGDEVQAVRIEAEGHVTQPPARLTEASLVKMLEESGIGRPSTYASIIRTILKREYTFKKGSALVPTFTAFAVVQLMKEHLASLIDSAFTAKMEDRLDAIARGEEDALPYLREFYSGNGTRGLKPILEQLDETIDARAVCTIPLAFRVDDQEVAVRVGRFGPFLRVGELRVPLEDNICPDALTAERVRAMTEEVAAGPQCLGTHPETREPIYLRKGRFGPYVQLGDVAADSKQKPKMVSLLPEMTPETLTYTQALELLALPRTLGEDADGKPVSAHLGRYGPYIKRDTDTRSLAPEDDILTVDLERALELLAQEKRRGRTAAEPLKIFAGVAALDNKDVRLMQGRYGPYVTDGEVNATLPRTIQDPLALDEGQAVQLILDKHARGPVRRKKATARKAGAGKKAGGKKATARKATARKAGAGKKATARKADAGKKAGGKKAGGKKAGGKKATARKAGAGKKTGAARKAGGKSASPDRTAG